MKLFMSVSDDNGRVEYNIISGDEDSAFEVDIDNGTVRTRRPLDRETKPVYNLVVMATDQAKVASHRLSSTVQVQLVAGGILFVPVREVFYLWDKSLLYALFKMVTLYK